MSADRVKALVGFILGCSVLGLGLDHQSWTLGLLGLSGILAAPCLSFGAAAVWPVAGFILGGLLFGWGLDVDSLAIALGGLGVMIAAPLALTSMSGETEREEDDP